MPEHITELSDGEIDAVAGGWFFGDIQSNIAVVGQNATSSQYAGNFAGGGGNVQFNIQKAENENDAYVKQVNVD